MNSDKSINPLSMNPVDAAKLLSAAGSKLVTKEMIEKDVNAGAPVNPDGTINLVHYAAWLVKEAASRC